jgi:uncharacterized protein
MRVMSVKYLPEHIDPFRFAEQNLGLDGIVKLSDMPRLSVNLAKDDSTAAVDLTFGRDEQGVVFLKGHVETHLWLQCQRCLEPYKYEIISNFMLGIVNTLEEVNDLPEHYEPALTSGGQLALRELIEDELILNLPIIPRHELDTCKVKLPVHDAGWDDETKDKKKNPFHVLANLKDKQ